MELAEQERLPQGKKFALRIGALSGGERRRAEHFRGAERFFGAAVGELLRGLRGIGRAVHFEVEFAGPDVEVGLLRGDPVHRVLRETERNGRAAVERGAAQAALDVFLLRTAAAVAHAVERDRDVDDPRLAVVRLVLAEFLGPQARIVVVLRREMRDDARSVDALPDERIVRELVVAVPRELLREEEADSALLEDLRELAGVAENVGKPEVPRNDAELLLEETLADETLAHERFARGDVAVRLDPHAALHFPTAVRDGLFHFFVERRIVFLADFVELRLRRAVFEARVALHVEDLARERAPDLADRFAQRPEPLHVDVRMPDRGHLGGGGIDADAPDRLLQRRVRRRRPAAFGRQQVERAARRAGDLDAARRFLRQSAQERVDDVQIELEKPLVAVEPADRKFHDRRGIGAVQVLERNVRRGGIRETAHAEHVVRAGFDPEIDRLAALRLRKPVEVVLAVAVEERAAVREADDRTALRVEDAAFAAEIEIERDIGALPRLRNRARHVEPRAFERAAPPLALFDRAVFQFRAVRPRDRLLRDRDFGAQRFAHDVDFLCKTGSGLADAGLVDVEVEVGHVWFSVRPF